MQLPYDWFPGSIPDNVVLEADAYLDSSYSFAAFTSRRTPGMTIGRSSGIYNRSTIISGPDGRIDVGDFTVLNQTYVICMDRVTIGAHCLIAWGVVITDSWFPDHVPLHARSAAMRAVASDDLRRQPTLTTARPVRIADNVWVGFDAVVLPGVTLGRGCIVGAKCVVSSDVPEYAVVVGNPARIVRMLDPGDTPEARRRAIAEYSRDTR